MKTQFQKRNGICLHCLEFACHHSKGSRAKPKYRGNASKFIKLHKQMIKYKKMTQWRKMEIKRL